MKTLTYSEAGCVNGAWVTTFGACFLKVLVPTVGTGIGLLSGASYLGVSSMYQTYKHSMFTEEAQVYLDVAFNVSTLTVLSTSLITGSVAGYFLIRD